MQRNFCCMPNFVKCTECIVRSTFWMNGKWNLKTLINEKNAGTQSIIFEWIWIIRFSQAHCKSLEFTIQVMSFNTIFTSIVDMRGLTGSGSLKFITRNDHNSCGRYRWWIWTTDLKLLGGVYMLGGTLAITYLRLQLHHPGASVLHKKTVIKVMTVGDLNSNVIMQFHGVTYYRIGWYHTTELVLSNLNGNNL